MLAVYQAPGANALAVSEAVLKQSWSGSRKVFPDDVQYEVPYQLHRFRREQSLNDVVSTLILTFILVMTVVFIFLGAGGRRSFRWSQSRFR